MRGSKKKSKKTQTWEDIHRNELIRELIYIGIMLFLCIFGAVCDWMRFYRPEIVEKYFWKIDDFGGLSSQLLSIQATTLTLTFALLSLISGHMTTVYMGVAFNDFIMNIKPVILKQKHVIVVSILLIIAGAFFQAMGWYNLVCCFTFVSTCMLIMFSAVSIYGIFSGTEQIKNEIMLYLISEFEERKEGEA